MGVDMTTAQEEISGTVLSICHMESDAAVFDRQLGPNTGLPGRSFDRHENEISGRTRRAAYGAGGHQRVGRSIRSRVLVGIGQSAKAGEWGGGTVWRSSAKQSQFSPVSGVSSVGDDSVWASSLLILLIPQPAVKQIASCS